MSIVIEFETDPKKQTIFQFIKKLKCKLCKGKLQYKGMKLKKDGTKVYVFWCPRCFWFWFYDVDKKLWEKEKEIRMNKEEK